MASLPRLAGNDLSTGKPVSWNPQDGVSVVVFLSPFCPCSQSHEAAVKTLAAKYPKVAFWGVSSGTPVKAAEAYFKNRLPFPVLAEPEVEWADSFGALNTPHVFVVSAAGEVVYQGGVDDRRDGNSGEPGRNYLAEVLKDLDQGKTPRVARSRALGCAIRK